MGLLISSTDLFSQPAFLDKPFVFVVRYCHFSLINLLLLNYSTAAFRFTVIIHFLIIVFQLYYIQREYTVLLKVYLFVVFFYFFFFILFLLLLLLFLLSLSLSSWLPPGHFSPLFLFSSHRHRGCRAKARRRARNILAQLCFAPDDSQHYRSLGVDASFFLPYPGIPILLHTLFVPLLLPFFL